MIDVDLIEKKIDSVVRNLRYLDGLDEVGRDQFLSSYEKRQATKHSLQEAIEACLDVANHIAAAENFERGDTYAEMFLVLGKEGVIGEELAEGLADMAKFRNLLVHRYGEVDDEIVWEIAREGPEDIEEFVVEVEAWLSR